MHPAPSCQAHALNRSHPQFQPSTSRLHSPSTSNPTRAPSWTTCSGRRANLGQKNSGQVLDLHNRAPKTCQLIWLPPLRSTWDSPPNSSHSFTLIDAPDGTVSLYIQADVFTHLHPVAILHIQTADNVFRKEGMPGSYELCRFLICNKLLDMGANTVAAVMSVGST